MQRFSFPFSDSEFDRWYYEISNHDIGIFWKFDVVELMIWKCETIGIANGTTIISKNVIWFIVKISLPS